MPKNKTNGSTSTAMQKWDAKLAEMAKSSKKAVAGIGSGGNFISCRGGHLAYQGLPFPGDKMKVIVVDWILENVAYEGRFDEENPQSPFCYAFGRSKDEMAPNPNDVPEPVNATCDGCPNNQWGSAETGKGKACAEVARLALLAEGDFGDVETATEAYFKVNVTSMKYWAGYVRDLEQTYHRPPLAFITEVSLVAQQALPGWHAEFKMVEPIDDPETFEALMGKYDAVSAKIAFPYPKFQEAPPAPARPARRAVAVAPKAPVRPASPRVTRGAVGATARKGAAVSAAPVSSSRGVAAGRKGAVAAPKF